ncbi:MAG: redoxin domain-containing protein [Elusimicrobiota bacterium]|jgi:hypothetical protein
MLKRLPLALGLAALLAWPPSGRAARPITPPAPDFPQDAIWFNAQPLSLQRLRRRRVVLTAFFSTANINSIRALQTLKAWHKNYELAGLMVVGVHTPEFPFQKDPIRVRAELKRLGVRFPVLLDNDRRLWQAYANDGWPAFYLIDPKGRIVFDRLGEGRYAEFEGEIRAALDAGGFDTSGWGDKVKDPEAAGCGAMSPDSSLGANRGALIDLNHQPPAKSILVSAREGELAYKRSWDLDPDAVRLSRDNRDLSAFWRLVYRGAGAFAVLSPLGTARFYVRQDGAWLHPDIAGRDIAFDQDGRSYVPAAEPRLFHLTRNANDDLHELSISPDRAGAAIFGFSFTDRCLPVEP